MHLKPSRAVNMTQAYAHFNRNYDKNTITIPALVVESKQGHDGHIATESLNVGTVDHNTNNGGIQPSMIPDCRIGIDHDGSAASSVFTSVHKATPVPFSSRPTHILRCTPPLHLSEKMHKPLDADLGSRLVDSNFITHHSTEVGCSDSSSACIGNSSGMAPINEQTYSSTTIEESITITEILTNEAVITINSLEKTDLQNVNISKPAECISSVNANALIFSQNDELVSLPVYNTDNVSFMIDSGITIHTGADSLIPNISSNVDGLNEPPPIIMIVDDQSMALKSLSSEEPNVPNPLQCTFCGKLHKTFSRLDRHLITHSNERPFSCEHCSKTFKRSYELKVHMKIHTKEKRFVCDICGNAFTQKYHLTTHRRRHLGDYKYICSICQKGFHSRDELQSHKNTQHNQNEYVCNICGRSFANKKNFVKHKLLHDPSFIPEKKHQCETCGKAFVNKSGLSTHKLSHTGDNIFTCKVCGKTVSSKDSLKSHMTIHTGEKPFVCDVCGKAFRCRENMRIHVRIHTGERPFSCDTCHLSFSQRSTLTTHKLFHSGQRPFKCNLCPRGFVSKSLLRVHLSSAHSKRP